MGSYSPVPTVDTKLYRELVDLVVRPTVAELSRRGIDFRGVLYAGLMLTKDGPKVLEFNCRFGDPETQALLPRLESRSAGTAVDGRERRSSACLRGLATGSRGGRRDGVARAIPPRASKGDVIGGLGRARRLEGVEVFHAATKEVGGSIVTSGGRVLTVTGLGDTFAEARARAYAGVAEIRFEGEQHRSDIALRAEKWEARAGDVQADEAQARGEGR